MLHCQSFFDYAKIIIISIIIEYFNGNIADNRKIVTPMSGAKLRCIDPI